MAIDIIDLPWGPHSAKPSSVDVFGGFSNTGDGHALKRGKCGKISYLYFHGEQFDEKKNVSHLSKSLNKYTFDCVKWNEMNIYIVGGY